MAKKSSGKAGPIASLSPKSEKAEMRDRLEASGIRRTKKAAKYPAHKSGDALALAEEPDASGERGPQGGAGSPLPAAGSQPDDGAHGVTRPTCRPSALVDARVIYCGDNLEQLQKLPDACVDLIYIDPPFNSNRNYEAFWGETKEKRAFEDRHANTQAYIDFMHPRCVELARVPKKPAAFISTATGLPPITSKSCLARFSAKIK
jgi:hypothetical protein